MRSTRCGRPAGFPPMSPTRLEVDGWSRTTIDRFGHIDVWVGAAGVFGYGSAIEDARGSVRTHPRHQPRWGRCAGPHVLPHARPPIWGDHPHRVDVLDPECAAMSRRTSPASTGSAASPSSVRQELRGTPLRLALVLPATMDTPIYEHAPNYTGRETRQLPLVSDARQVAKRDPCGSRGAPTRDDGGPGAGPAMIRSVRLPVDSTTRSSRRSCGAAGSPTGWSSRTWARSTSPTRRPTPSAAAGAGSATRIRPTRPAVRRSGATTEASASAAVERSGRR